MTSCDCRSEGGITDGGSNAPEDGGLEVDTALSLLSHKRRRRVLELLRGEPTHSTTLADVVDALNTDREQLDPGGAGTDSEEQLAIAMRHIHIPKLEAEGVIHVDDASGTITYDGDPTIEALLDCIEKRLK